MVEKREMQKAQNRVNEKPRIRLPNIETLEKEIKEIIIGQDVAVKKTITAIYRSIRFKSIKSNVLMIGNSGVGKTELIKQIAKRLNIPYTIEDATKYTKEGYYGADVKQMIFNLLDNANNDVRKAANGILVIDEIDKKVTDDGSQSQISGTDVLKSLLKIIEGTKVKVDVFKRNGDYCDVYFDTSNLTIICMGAFEGLDIIRDKRLNTKQIGFKSDFSNSPESKVFTKQDLVKYGMPEEFVGRFDTLVQLNELGKDDLYKIIKYSKISIFRKYEEELVRRRIKLEFDDELFKSIAEASLNVKTGARELSNVVNYMFENIIYDILNSKIFYTKCILLPGIVYDNTQYKLS